MKPSPETQARVYRWAVKSHQMGQTTRIRVPYGHEGSRAAQVREVICGVIYIDDDRNEGFLRAVQPEELR